IERWRLGTPSADARRAVRHRCRLTGFAWVERAGANPRSYRTGPGLSHRAAATRRRMARNDASARNAELRAAYLYFRMGDSCADPDEIGLHVLRCVDSKDSQRLHQLPVIELRH